MKPVKFEIVAEDKTKPGTDSAGQNLDVLNQRINTQKSLILSLQEEITRLQKESSKGTGLRSVEDIATLEQLEKKVKELQISLVELENQKEKVNNTPVIPPSVGQQAGVAKQSVAGLSMSVQQIARELPSLAMGPQMFFLAISNNIPILQDSIRTARAELAAMSAEQRKNAIPLWRQLTSSIFSWQTALTIAITLLVVYGKDLVNWTANLFKSKEAIDANVKAMNDLGSARLKGAQSAQSELTRLKLLYKGLTDENVARKDRLRIAKELREKYPSYFSNLSTEQMLAGKAANAYIKLSKAILETAKARAIEDKILDNQKKILDLQGRYAKEKGVLENMPVTELRSYGGRQWNAESGDYKLQKQKVEDIKTLWNELENSNEKLAKRILENPVALLGVGSKDPKPVKDIENLSDRIADAEVAARKRIDELTLAAMRDGYKKQKAEARLQLQNDLDQIDKEARERLQALEKARKKGLPVTKGQIASVGTMADTERDLAQEAYNKKIVTLFEVQMDGLTDKYQDYANKRLAIERRYNEDIRNLINLRAEAEANGDTVAVNRLSAAIAAATASKGKELIKSSFEQFQKSPEYIRAFEDLRSTSSETLQYLMTEMEKFKGVAAEAWNPEDLREYMTTLQEIADELAARNPLEMLIEKRKELAAAEREMQSAQKALDAVRSGAQVTSGIKMTSGKLSPVFLSEDAALKNLNKSKDRYKKKELEVLKLQDEVLDQVHEMYAQYSAIAQVIGGVQGEIVGLIADLGNYTFNAIDGISKLKKKAVTALEGMEKASVILTLISTGIQLLKTLEDITPDAYDKYLKYDEKIEEINRLKDAVLDYELAVLKAQQAEKGWFGEDNLQSLKDYKEQQKKITEQYIAKAREQQAIYQNQKGGGWLTNSLNYGLLGGIDTVFGTNILGNKYQQGTLDAMNNLRIETRKKSKGFLGSGIGGKSQKTEDLVSWARNNGLGDLFSSDVITNGSGGSAPLVNLSVAQSILDNYGNKLVGQTKETLEELVELRKQYDNFVAQLQQYVSEMYSPLVDNMVDGLWDWLDEGESALDSFKDYAKSTFRDIVSDMLRTIVMKKVLGKFEDDIAKLYEKFSGNDTDMASFSAEITARIKSLTDKYAQELPYLQELLKQINDNFSLAGFDLKDTEGASQSANSSVASQVTEDTMTWLAGSMVAQTNRLISVDNNISEFRGQVDKALAPLTQIAANTKATADKLGGIAADIMVIRRDGVNIKD